MIEFELKYEVHLLTGFQVQSGYGHQHLNQVVVRDHNKNLVIPGSSLKGRMRYYFGLLESMLYDKAKAGIKEDPDSKLMQSLFGSRLEKGKLFFEAASLKEEFKPDKKQQQKRFQYSEERTGIQINRQLGSVNAHALRFYETSPTGLQFESVIEGTLPQEEIIEKSERLNFLLATMKLFQKLGADKSRGNGSVQLVPTILTVQKVGQPKQKYGPPEIALLLENFMKESPYLSEEV